MLLQERLMSAGVGSVDRAAGVLKNVKVLGLESRNGRRYDPAAVKAAVSLYEGCPVGIDHARENGRSYKDRFGVLRNARYVENDGLRADLHFNVKHPMAEQVLFDAEQAPQNVGLSHDVDAQMGRGTDGKPMVTAIRKVNSVDLVANPATTNGLFESDHSADVADFVDSLRQDSDPPRFTPPIMEPMPMPVLTEAERPAPGEDEPNSFVPSAARVRRTVSKLRYGG